MHDSSGIKARDRTRATLNFLVAVTSDSARQHRAAFAPALEQIRLRGMWADYHEMRAASAKSARDSQYTVAHRASQARTRARTKAALARLVGEPVPSLRSLPTPGAYAAAYSANDAEALRQLTESAQRLMAVVLAHQ